jgi:prepilin-type N-terminal cleavage/methylation domain-containing protein
LVVEVKRMFAKGKKSAFTMVELLIVIGIIAILIALLIPALSMVRKMAKTTQQRAQLTTIEMALTAFKNDYGDYPPSSWQEIGGALKTDYSGAQMLTEALVGWDLRGFHPKSAWRADGKDKGGGNDAYDPPNPSEENLKARKGPYLEIATAHVFKLGNTTKGPGLFKDMGASFLNPETYVICDVFTVRRIDAPPKPAAKAGTPILYYRANTSIKSFDPNSPEYDKQIYNAYDNFDLINLKSVTVDGRAGKPHLLGGNNEPEKLYKPDYEGGIRDSKINKPWPHRPDSYILISAGADGLYGTSDDIRNF